jgi:hypothetical protein
MSSETNNVIRTESDVDSVKLQINEVAGGKPTI